MILATILSTAVLAAPSDYGYKQDYFPPCKHYVDNPKTMARITSPKGYGEEYTCESSFSYFKSTHSPTLIQCAKIACAPGQTKHYVQRALYQCYALEKQAKATNGGHLPKGW
ncbi:hypothetical protein EDD86DRAFT_134654 [Gorgonomyces haynaldii]|nr:hypothetical protein EDD86DRAFT_134654 [Gorgonomyces haynaldii]